ncbi:hypothetical protein FACS189419_02290 [Planctomycetales bacterium]|nr:hypothetical protein FACS189419_02290 [Planctomycetales bacterium]
MLHTGKLFNLVLLVLAAVLLQGDVLGADSGKMVSLCCAEDMSEGIRLVKLGDMAGASIVLQRASQEKRFDRDWKDELDTLIYIAELQNIVRTEKDPERWNLAAEQLRICYIEVGLYSEAVLTAKQRFVRQRTIPAALVVVETCVATEQLKEASAFIRYLELIFKNDYKAVSAVEIMQAWVYLKMGKYETAKTYVRQLNVCDEIKDPELLFLLAKVQAATRQFASSVKTLKKCFLVTPPDILPLLKEDTLKSEEFAPILDAEEFQQVMTAESELPSMAARFANHKLKRQVEKEILKRAESLENYQMQGINVSDWQYRRVFR